MSATRVARDGLYQVTYGTLCAGFVVYGGYVRQCAPVLRRRIDERVERMFELGLVAETERLSKQGLESNPVAMQALGYRQVLEHLRGVRSLQDTVQLVKIRTRQFAKRQMTWFKRQLPMDWIGIDDETGAGLVADQIERTFAGDSHAQIAKGK